MFQFLDTIMNSLYNRCLHYHFFRILCIINNDFIKMKFFIIFMLTYFLFE